MKRLLLTAAAMLLCAAASATGATLRIGISQFPTTLHPNIDSMLAKSFILGMARRPFTAYDHDWQLVCMLCVELPSLDNGGAVRETTADGKPGIAVTYTIRPDAFWDDGTPLTTDDVLFTYRVGRTAEAGISNQELYRRILDVEVRDEKTFTLHIDRVTFDYAAINDFQPLPAHLEQPVFDANPAEYRNRTLYLTDPTRAGLYFGPYRVGQFVSGSAVTLERNPHWWGTPAAFERVIVKTVENTAALEAHLLSGEIDMVAGGLGFSLEQALAFEQRNGDAYNVLYQSGLFYEHIDLQLDNPILQDVRVRQALLYGLDRASISRELFAGKQPIANTSVNSLDWVYSDDVPAYDYDPDRAAALLEEAGWTPGPDGIRRNAAGETLTLELMTTSGNRSRELVQQVMQSQWNALGIDIRIRNEPARVYFGQTLRQRKFTGMALFAWISSPENVPRTTLHSTMVPTAENGWSGQNLTGYANPDMDRVLDAVELELDRDKRKTLWAEIQRLYATELPVLPLFFLANAYVLPTWLDGVRPTGHMSPVTLWIEQWRRRS